MIAVDGTWAAVIVALQVAVIGLIVVTERRLTRIETDMRWLIGRRRPDREAIKHGTPTDSKH